VTINYYLKNNNHTNKNVNNKHKSEIELGKNTILKKLDVDEEEPKTRNDILVTTHLVTHLVWPHQPEN